jgi:hypothetical protein
MIINDPHFHKLYETEKFTVGYVYEYAYLIRKKRYEEIYMGGFYGDPACGLIDSNNNWCLVGGNMLSIWTESKGMLEIEDEELSWICKVRQKSAYEVEILIDPLSEKGSVWALNIETLQRHKLRDYKINDEYSEQVDW